MAPENLKKTNPDSTLTADDANAMERYGITRVPVDYFWFREFRYTNLKDAIAQAKRQEISDIERSAQPAK